MERLSNIRIHTLCKSFPTVDTLVVVGVKVVNNHIIIVADDDTTYDLGVVSATNLVANTPVDSPCEKGGNVARSNVLATLLRGIDGKDGITPDMSDYYDKNTVEQKLLKKENAIPDLGVIRRNASMGATAVQPSQLANVATSGNYNDLSDKPSIPAEVTEATVSSWGFTKNTGTYSKPESGIPASDLAPDVFLQGEKGDTGPQGPQGPQGPKGDDGYVGDDGATFTPSVDSDGNLSWTNNKGLPNPATVNIKGPKGDSGSGGGGGIAVETDPVFSASPAADITEAKMIEWDNKVDKVEGKGLSTNDFTDEEKARVAEVENKADKNGRYLDLAAGYYVENVELSGEMKSGNLNAGGGISNSSSTHLLIDISNVSNDSTIRVSTTYNSEYTTLWALWEVAYDPATVNWKYLLDKGPLCSVAQSADIDLSRYEGRAPRYLYVAVGAAGNSASATILLQAKNIAEKFDEIEETISNVGENIEIKGTYPDVSVGGYLYTPDIYTEIRDGSLNDIGGISTPSAPRSYLFVDISHLAGTGKIVVKTTNNNAYSRLWALWKTPTAENGSNKVAIGPMSSESQEDVIDLSQYPDAKYLYVTIGAEGNSASATVQPQAKNIAEKFDEVEKALLYIPNIVLPTEIEVAVGDTLNLYYKSMIEANDIGNHQVEVLCDVGQSYPRYYTFHPLTSQAGKSYTLSVSLKDDRGEQLANANTNIVVKAIPTTTTTKNILTLGASMVANGNIAYELKRRLTTTSGDDTPANPTGIGLSNISFVGRQKAAYADVQQEATGGWAWRDYVTQGRQAYRFQVSGVKSVNMGDVYVGGGLTFTITEINVTDGVGNIRCTYTGSGTLPTSGNLARNKGNGDATIAYSSYASESYNPFYNDGALDIQHYADLYCNGNIDILIAVCGTNDLFTTRPIAEIMDDVKTFARAYHTVFPNGKFILSTLPLPSPIGGMGANYNATKDNYYNIALRMFGFAKGIYDMCRDIEFASYVVGCSTLQTFDIDNLYPYAEKPVNNRMPNVKEKIGTNGVHPTIEGYKTIADALYSTIVGLL